MGLDQYLYIKYPNIIEGTNRGKQIAYWRKDWALQYYINSNNGEIVEVTEDFCNDILQNLHIIYSSDDYDVPDSYKTRTKNAFTKALQLLSEGKEIVYDADW